MLFEELLKSGTRALEGVSETARLDAELLMCHAVGCTRAGLHSRMKDEVGIDEVSRFRVFMERRRTHEPIAYILGVKEFWSLDFVVTSSVLVPRPETELLVENALETLKRREGELAVLDLGTGSGCIAVALAHELKRFGLPFTMLAVDTSSDALEVAAENAVRHSVGGDVNFLQSEWFSELDPARDRFDLIAANPPYVDKGAVSINPQLRHEPAEALFAGEEGTEVIVRLMEQVSVYLKPQGVFLCEIGAGQRAALEGRFRRVRNHCCPPLGTITFLQDLAGRDRVMKIAQQLI